MVSRRFLALLSVTFVCLLAVAGLVGYAVADEKRRGMITALEQRNASVTKAYRVEQLRFDQLKQMLEDREKLPNVNMREFNATQTVTFTIDGRKLKCLALLNESGDAQTLSCDWAAWRNR